MNACLAVDLDEAAALTAFVRLVDSAKLPRLKERRRRARTSPADESPVIAAIRYGARQFGGPLLRARSRKELEDVADSLSQDPAYLHFNDHLTDILRQAPPVAMSEQEVSRTLGGLLGPKWLPKVQRWAALMACADAAASKLHDAAIDSPRRPASTDSEVIHDLAAPRFYVQAVRGALRSGLCQLGLVSNYFRRARIRRGEEWRMEALLDGVLSGLTKYLELLAVIPEAEVPDGVVKRAEGVKWEALVREWDEVRDRLDESAEAAAFAHESGEDPFRDMP